MSAVRCNGCGNRRVVRQYEEALTGRKHWLCLKCAAAAGRDVDLIPCAATGPEADAPIRHTWSRRVRLAAMAKRMAGIATRAVGRRRVTARIAGGIGK